MVKTTPISILCISCWDKPQVVIMSHQPAGQFRCSSRLTHLANPHTVEAYFRILLASSLFLPKTSNRVSFKIPSSPRGSFITRMR